MRAIAAILLIGGLAACSKTDLQSGIGVGNGRTTPKMVTFESKHGFRFRYLSTLHLTASQDEKSVTVDNSELVEPASQLSYVQFDTKPKEENHGVLIPGASLEDHLPKLAEYAERTWGQERRRMVKLPGAIALVAAQWSPDALVATYAILTVNYDLVLVKVEAHNAGHGLEWVAPIIDTFECSFVPPRVSTVFLDREAVIAGSSIRLWFQATHSTEEEIAVRSCVRFRAVLPSTGDSIAHCGPTQPHADGWYSTEIPTRRFTQNASLIRYQITKFTVTDDQGKTTVLKLDQEQQALVERNPFPGSDMPAIESPSFILLEMAQMTLQAMKFVFR